MWRRPRSPASAVAIFFLILAVLAVIENPEAWVSLLVLAGIFFMVRQFETGGSRSRTASYEREAEPVEIRHPEVRISSAPQHRIYQHALDAVEAAGLDPETVAVLATDIGMMGYQGDQDPTVCRTRDIYDDVDYIQPYVQLRLAAKAVGLIRFEIEDSSGKTVFIHEEHHQLEKGRNLISPAARLRIDPDKATGEWLLRVTADGVPLALHHFGWQESTTTLVRRHLGEDGEISSELRAALAEDRLQGLSLDELLSDQDAESRQR